MTTFAVLLISHSCTINIKNRTCVTLHLHPNNPLKTLIFQNLLILKLLLNSDAYKICVSECKPPDLFSDLREMGWWTVKCVTSPFAPLSRRKMYAFK